jgi:hypothetical protein
MKTVGRGNQNQHATVRSKPSSWSGKLEQLLLNYTGWRARKILAAGEVFFLTSPFIELTRWDEKAGLQRDAVRSQMIDAPKAQWKGDRLWKKISTVA